MKRILLALLALGLAVPAMAADHKLTVGAEHTSYNEDFGHRNTFGIEKSADFGDTTIIFGYTRGNRDYGLFDFDANRYSLSLYHDWNSTFSTRTSASAATDSPVFATRDYQQDLSIKAGAAVFTVGGRRTNYFQDVDVTSWNAGGALYFDRGSVSYRYTSYDVSDLGTTDGHLASLRLKDGSGAGSTQLWVGHGSILQEYDFLPTTADGDMTSVTIRRVQPLTQNVALNVSVGRVQYDTRFSDYDGNTVGLGLTFGW